MLKMWIAARREQEEFRAAEREKDRMARHAANNALTNAIAEIHLNHKESLKLVSETVCRYDSRLDGRMKLG